MAKVLVIDDEPSIATLVAEIIEGYGHEVITASDGRQGLELIKTNRFGMVISDIMMPHLSGRELLRVVRADPKLRDIHFVLMSAVENLANLDHKVAADAFIVKPFDISVIDRLVVAFLNEPPPAETGQSASLSQKIQPKDFILKLKPAI